MPFLSLIEVAKRTGKARSSIYRMISEGRLSATLDQRGNKTVELTEALRVFGTLKDDNEVEPSPQDRRDTVAISRESQSGTLVSAIQELDKARFELQFKVKELELKDRELALMQARVEEVKSAHEQVTAEKNKFLEIIERQSLLLAAPKPATTRRAPAVKKAAPKAAPATTSTKHRVSVAKSTTPKKPAPKAVIKPTAATKPSTKAKDSKAPSARKATTRRK